MNQQTLKAPITFSGHGLHTGVRATMTVHPVRISGTVIGAPQTFRHFADMQKRITAFICRHSKASEETVTRLMMNPDQMANDVGTVIDGNEAVSYGIIDKVGGLSDALAALRELVKKTEKE